MNATVEMSPELAALTMSIAELETKLLEQDPEMPNYLRKISLALLKHPELVHILRDEQRAVIIDGLMQQTGVEFAANEAKTAKRADSKKFAKHTEDDI
jgi:hypothetical protein